MKLRKFNISIIVISLVLLFTYFVWAKTIPFNGAPDEYLRYQIPKFIYNYGKLPTGFDAETVFDRGYWSYGFYPQLLAPLLSAFFMKLVSLFEQSETTLLMAARLTSMLSGVLVSYVFGKTVERLTHSKYFQLLAMCFIGLWPQIIFLSSYVNNDIIGLLGVALIIDVVVKTSQDKRWTYKDTLYLSLGFTISLLGYLNTYGFVLFAGFYFLFAIFKSEKGQDYEYLRMLNHCLILSIILLGIVAPFFLRNWVLYGDLFGNKTFESVHERWIADGGESMLNGAVESGLSFIEFLTWGEFDFITQTWQSFIGKFSYMSLLLSNMLYNIYGYVLIVGMILATLFGFIRKKSVWQVNANVMMSLSILVTIILHLYRSYFTDYQPQGRYIIGIFVPLSLMMLFGYWKLLTPLGKFKNRVVILAIFLIAIGSIHIYYNYIYDFYIIRKLGVIYN